MGICKGLGSTNFLLSSMFKERPMVEVPFAMIILIKQCDIIRSMTRCRYVVFFFRTASTNVGISFWGETFYRKWNMLYCIKLDRFIQIGLTTNSSTICYDSWKQMVVTHLTVYTLGCKGSRSERLSSCPVRFPEKRGTKKFSSMLFCTSRRLYVHSVSSSICVSDNWRFS